MSPYENAEGDSPADFHVPKETLSQESNMKAEYNKNGHTKNLAYQVQKDLRMVVVKQKALPACSFG